MSDAPDDEVLSRQGSLVPAEQSRQQEFFRKTVYVLHSTPSAELTLVQRRLANAWLKYAIEEEPDGSGWWTMPMARLRQDIGFGSNNIAHLRDAARKIQRIAFEWDVLAPESKRVKWITQTLFPSVAIAEGYIQFQIGSDIFREIRRPEVYGLIDMAVMRKLSTTASLQIWEYCVRFENIGQTKIMKWEEFRDKVLGSGDKASFKEYKTLKLRVLSKAIAEINRETAHQVELVEFKEGRRIAAIQFKVRRKDGPTPLGDAKTLQMVSSLGRIGVPKAEAQRLLRKHSAGEIDAALAYTDRRMGDVQQAPLENPPAYFRKALEMGYGQASNAAVESSQSKSKKPVQKFDIREAFRDQQREKARKLYAEFDPEEKSEFTTRYNDQQANSQFKVKSRLTKAAEVAFMDWLARETWGEPTAEELLSFSAKLLAGRKPA